MGGVPDPQRQGTKIRPGRTKQSLEEGAAGRPDMR